MACELCAHVVYDMIRGPPQENQLLIKLIATVKDALSCTKIIWLKRVPTSRMFRNVNTVPTTSGTNFKSTATTTLKVDGH